MSRTRDFGSLHKSSTSPEQESADQDARRTLEEFAVECNPRIDFFDPLQLADQNFWGFSKASTIAFLRHSEIKHGRTAMLAFCGYVIQANHIHFPWATEANGFPPASLSPPEQWDVLNPLAKFQLFFFIGMLEIWSEAAPNSPHYMRGGGQPGKFPRFEDSKGQRIPFLPIDLWDPLGFTDTMSPQTKKVKLAKEVNNGRLAMLGLFAFFVESKIPGAIPILDSFNIVKPYAGDYLLPFNYWDFIGYFFGKSDFSSAASSYSTPEITPW
jgi:hypothetical protein